MNAIVERGMVNPTSSAVLRGKDAVSEMLDLLVSLQTINRDIEEVGEVENDDCPCFMGITITRSEFLYVLHRRRIEVTTKLENKGIRIAPDPTPAFSEDVA